MTLLASAKDLNDVGNGCHSARLSPAKHAVWTALAAAALWWALGEHPAMETARAGSQALLAVVVLHTLWQAPVLGSATCLARLFSVAALPGLFHRAMLR